MNFRLTNHANSRAWFKWKGVANIAALLGIFVFLVLVLTWFASIVYPGRIGQIVADVLAIGSVAFLYTSLDRNPIRLQCPHCNKFIVSNTPWICGYCKKPNQNAKENSFLDKCVHCNDEPKTYQCHHCCKLIFFTKDKAKTNFARCLNAPTDPVPEDPNLVAQRTRNEAKRAKEHEIQMAELEEKHDAYKKRKEMAPPKSPREAVQKDFELAHTKAMGAEEFAREQIALAEEKYKNDPYMKERAIRFIKSWLQSKVG